MKKIILVFLFALVPALAYSQLSIGLSAGFNSSKLSTDFDEINSNFKSGFQFGLYTRLGGTLFIQPEFLYSSRGGFSQFETEFWQSVGLKGEGTEIHTGLFQIPVVVGYKLLEGQNTSLNIQAGPVLSIVADKGLAGVDEVFSQKDIQDYSFGLLLGGGIDLSNISLNVRYEYTLSDVYKVESEVADRTISSKAHTFLVTIGFRLFNF